MFTDSEIAKDFQLSCTKLTYITNFGITPYFHQLFIDELKNCNYYSLSFDESLNDVTQICQMDINIRFWSKAKQKACVRYFDSKFLGDTTANDLLASCNEIINTIDSGNKMIQISIDGPSTNWKLFELERLRRKGTKKIVRYLTPRHLTPRHLKYWVGVQRGQSYLMGRRCLFSLGWPPF